MDDPGRYGASFADVYDRWYPGGDEDDVCRFLSRRVGPGSDAPGPHGSLSHVIELGVGTGRLALSLAAAGFRVTGIDSSVEMLAALAEKDPRATVGRVLADAGDPGWFRRLDRIGMADVVLAPCNLLLNLVADGAQQGCVRGAGEALRPGGLLVVELSRLAAPGPEDGQSGEAGPGATASAGLVRRRAPSTSAGSSDVVVETEHDPRTGIVRGRHVENRDGTEVEVRPWTIRLLDAAGLDKMCAEAGLVPRGRFAGWSDRAAGAPDPVVVSVHRKAAHGS